MGMNCSLCPSQPIYFPYLTSSLPGPWNFLPLVPGKLPPSVFDLGNIPCFHLIDVLLASWARLHVFGALLTSHPYSWDNDSCSLFTDFVGHVDQAKLVGQSGNTIKQD